LGIGKTVKNKGGGSTKEKKSENEKPLSQSKQVRRNSVGMSREKGGRKKASPTSPKKSKSQKEEWLSSREKNNDG